MSSWREADYVIPKYGTLSCRLFSSEDNTPKTQKKLPLNYLKELRQGACTRKRTVAWENSNLKELCKAEQTPNYQASAVNILWGYTPALETLGQFHIP